MERSGSTTSAKMVSAVAFSKDSTIFKMSREDEANLVLITNGGRSKLVNTNTSANEKQVPHDHDDHYLSITDRNIPNIPGWFAEDCPIWPGESLYYGLYYRSFLDLDIYVCVCVCVCL